MRSLLLTLLLAVELVVTSGRSSGSEPPTKVDNSPPPVAFNQPSSATIKAENNITAPANSANSFKAPWVQADPVHEDPSWSYHKRLFYRFFLIPLDGILRYSLFTIPFWSVLLVTLLLERFIPADPKQKVFSVSFKHDLVWFIYQPLLHALVVGTFVAFITKIYKLYFSQFTVSLPGTPGWSRALIALLLVDLGYWIQHYINHKVPFLWKLHSVHHSQKELNFFTDYRYHPLEYIVRHTFITIPFLLLNVDPPVIVAIAIFRNWYSRFYHGNIRTNLGPLKYLLVTPQSHRVHHSLEARHRDMNFGALFSFWDFLFGKQYRGFDEYPATGIDDEAFPHEEKVGLKSLILTPWSQMIHRGARQQLSVANATPAKVEAEIAPF